MIELIDKIHPQSLNGSDLAYIGDAYYELWIRTYLISKGYTKPEQLHTLSVSYVNGAAHAKIISVVLDQFTLEELDVYHRGRNYNYKHRPKGIKMSEYIKSSGFEAVIGYLFITKNMDRLKELLNEAIEIIEETNE